MGKSCLEKKGEIVDGEWKLRAYQNLLRRGKRAGDFLVVVQAQRLIREQEETLEKLKRDTQKF